MNMRRKISNAYSGKSGVPDPDKDDKKPEVRSVSWQQFDQKPATAKKPAAAGVAKPSEIPPGLLKTGTEPQENEGVRKAAKFLLLLGQDEAAEIMRHLTEDELFDISSAMAGIKQVSKVEAEGILKEFGFLKVPPHSSSGGVDVARSFLTTAFGTEKAGVVLKKVLPFGDEKPFAFLEDYEAHQISALLKKEPSRVVAIVLRFLDAKKASSILQSLPASLRVDVLKSLGHMERLDTNALERMQDVLREKIRSQGKIVTQEVDGPSALAAILKHMSLDQEERLLGVIDEANPELGREIKDKVYTLDLILNVEDRELQMVLRTHPDEDIARMLKGRDMRVREKIMQNLSERRRQLIEEEIGYMGAIPRREADEAAKEFLDYLIKLSDQGDIHFLDREELV